MGYFRERVIGGIAGARVALARKGALVGKSTRFNGLDGFGLPGEAMGGVISHAEATRLAVKFEQVDAPFTACMTDPELVQQYPDEDRRAAVGQAVKTLIVARQTAQKAERMNQLMRERRS